jgi:hypothetical protein
MSEQLVFRFAGTVDKGDQAPNPNACLWVVETCVDPRGPIWHPRFDTACHSRKRAREVARGMRAGGFETRVVPYKACVDSKGRHNRQILSERLDA